MFIWNLKTPITFIASCIWNYSEYFNCPLGKHAPKVFQLSMGYKNKVK